MKKICFSCMEEIEDGVSSCSCCGKPINVEIPPYHLPTGTILNKKYLIGRSIGEGGFGITYIGRDTTLDMVIAVKEYFPMGNVGRGADFTVNPTTGKEGTFDHGRENFLKEARILARFSDQRGIVNVRDFFEENNTAYLIMEYLRGETLDKYLKRCGRIAPQETLKLMTPVMLTLKEMHSKGIIHRDISPDNIMICSDTTKLLDFGAARNTETMAERGLSIMIKRGYASEEQRRSRGEQGAWTDIYALCATMYKCITGKRPDDAAERIHDDELLPPSELGIAITPAFEYALMKGLAVFHDQRYKSIDELMDGFNSLAVPDDYDKDRTVYRGRDDENAASVSAPVNREPAAVRQNVKPVSVITPEPARAVRADHVNAPAPVAQPKRPQQVSSTVQPAEANAVPNSNNNLSQAQNANIKKTPPKKKKSSGGIGKKIGGILIGLAGAAIVITGAFVLINNFSKVTIAGKTYSKNEDSLYISSKDITLDDAKKILSLGDLKYMGFYKCTFTQEVVDKISEHPGLIKNLEFEGCSGIEDLSGISNFKVLNQFKLSSCGITDQILNTVEFADTAYPSTVKIDGNPEISDLSFLEGHADGLYSVDISGTSVSDISVLSSSKYLSNFYANDCQLTDLSDISSAAISHVEVSNNGITDLGDFYGKKLLYTLTANNNDLHDIPQLADCESLAYLELSDNELQSLEFLGKCREIKKLDVSNNHLKDLKGCETLIHLQDLNAEKNELTDIEELLNCTLLEKVDISDNTISDLSVLKPNVATLREVDISCCKISDISVLGGMTALERLYMNDNEVKSIDVLKDSPKIMLLNAENNCIESIESLENAYCMRYLRLANNNISDVSPLKNMTKGLTETTSGYITISTALYLTLNDNDISECELYFKDNIYYLSLHNNPLSYFKNLEGDKKCPRFTFTFNENLSWVDVKVASTYVVVDCPLNKQVECEAALNSAGFRGLVQFKTSEEMAEEQAKEDKKQRSETDDESEASEE